MRRGGIVQGEKNRNGFNRVNIESNGAAIGTKPSGMTLLLGSSAICNWLGLLLQLVITDLQVWIFRIDLLYISARRRFLYFVI